jgi:hypothetical protein
MQNIHLKTYTIILFGKLDVIKGNFNKFPYAKYSKNENPIYIKQIKLRQYTSIYPNYFLFSVTE